MLRPFNLCQHSARVFVLVATVLSCSAGAQTIRQVNDSATGQPVMYPSYITEYAGLLHFRGSDFPGGTNTELWRSDGQTAQRATDINPGNAGSSPAYLAVHNSTLYFAAAAASGGPKLWQYTPATGAALAPGSASQAGNPEELISFAGQLYYRAFRSNIGSELWHFDDVSQTPIDIFSGTGSSLPQHFAEYNGTLYFSANGTPGQGAELWRYSGTGVPTEAARIYPNNGSSPEHLTVFGNQLYFSANDGTHGRELWRFNGSTASMAADIVSGGAASASNPGEMVVFQDRLYFSADDGIHGCELWVFDGINAQLVTEINPTADPGNGDTFLMDSNPRDFAVLGDRLYFAADDGEHGRELWSYDGQTASLFADINPGQYGSDVSELTVHNGQLFFSADNGYSPGLGALAPRVFSLTVPEPGSGTLAALVLLALTPLLRKRRRRGTCQ
jgi:ELWxxDGT repeat protein